MKFFSRLLASFAALSLLAAAPASHPPGKIALQPARIDRTLTDMVKSGRVAGAEVLIWKDGREAYFRTTGWADREARRPMDRNDLFQVWSMTKPVTGVGLMRLWEQGRFGLDEPLAKYLPEYGKAVVVTGVDAAGKPLLKAPERPILIRDILRHTAGFAYIAGDTVSERMVASVDPLNPANTLAEFSRKMATIPLMYEPGTQWRYSAAVDVQARLIEVLSGQQFEDYMQAHVLRPLRMSNSAWTQPESRFKRLVTPYTMVGNKRLIRKSEIDKRALNFSDRKLTMGGAGLATTIDDYMRFARMMLNQGSLDGVQILKPSTIRLMTTDQLDPRVTQKDILVDRGNGGFGFDLFVRSRRLNSITEARGAVGEYFWDGAWSTLFWVDPANNMAVLFMVQREPSDLTLHREIRAAIYGADYLGPKGD